MTPSLHSSSTTLKLSLLACLLLLACTSLFAQSHPYITFDAPDATFGTFPYQINAAGQIVGEYVSDVSHGFLRNPDGSIVEFDVPGARDTLASSINNKGQIVGSADSIRGGHYEGFMRSPNGHISPIIYPGSAHTYVYKINDHGTIIGTYDDSSGVFQGFALDSSGTYTSIDVPGAGTSSGQGTSSSAINNNNEESGHYTDAVGVVHGFVRDAIGNITTFDVAGTTAIYPVDINSNGDVTGNATSTAGQPIAFIRYSDGTATTFPSTGAGVTFAECINDSGYVCGSTGSNTVPVGFLLDPSGNLVIESGPQPNSGSDCRSINNNLRVTGTYTDSSGKFHAWIK